MNPRCYFCGRFVTVNHPFVNMDYTPDTDWTIETFTFYHLSCKH